MILLLQDTRVNDFRVPLRKSVRVINSLHNTPTAMAAGGCTIVLKGPIARIPRTVINDQSSLDFFTAVKLMTSPPILLVSIYLPSNGVRLDQVNNFSTRAHHTLGKRYRLEMIKALHNLLSTHKDSLYILGGDLNRHFPSDRRFSRAEAATWEKLISTFGLVNSRSLVPLPPDAVTFKRGQSTSNPDHIFISPSSFLHPLGGEVKELLSSDHLPLCLDVLCPILPGFSPTTLPRYGPHLKGDEAIEEFAKRALQSYMEAGVGPPPLNTPNLLPQWINRVEEILSKLGEDYSRFRSSRKKPKTANREFILMRKVYNWSRKVTSGKRNLRIHYSHSISWTNKVNKSSLAVVPRLCCHKVISSVRDYIGSGDPHSREACVVAQREMKKFLHGHARSTLKQGRETYVHSFNEAFKRKKYKRVIRSALSRQSQSFDPSFVVDEDGSVVVGEDVTLPLIAQRFESTMDNVSRWDEDEVDRLFPLADGSLPEAHLPNLTPEDLIVYWKAKSKGKAPGMSGLTIDALIHSPHLVQFQIASALVVCWEQRIVVPSWKKKKMILLPKKSSPTAKDFRPISLIEILRKSLLGHLVYSSYRFDLLSNFQYGFRPGSGCDDATAMVTASILEAKGSKKPLIGISIDISKAFDRVPWSFIPHVMRRMGVHEDVSNYILEYERGGEAFIEGSNSSVSYQPKSGVPQGSVEGPLIWGAFINLLLRRLDNIKAEHKFKFFQTSHVSYADDTLFLAKVPAAIDLCWTALQEFLDLTGMSLSLSKCVIACNRRFIQVHGRRAAEYDWWNQLKVVGVEEFVHLGRPISFDLKLSSNSPSIISAHNSIKASLGVLGRKWISADVARYVTTAVLLPKISYFFRFIGDCNLLEGLDRTYRKIMRKKLGLPFGFPNVPITYPLGNYQYGISSFVMCVHSQQISTLHRLLQSHAPSFRAANTIWGSSLMVTGRKILQVSGSKLVTESFPGEMLQSWTEFAPDGINSLTGDVVIQYKLMEAAVQIGVEDSSSGFQTVFSVSTDLWDMNGRRSLIIPFLFACRTACVVDNPNSIHIIVPHRSIRDFAESPQSRKKCISLHVSHSDLWLEVLGLMKVQPILLLEGEATISGPVTRLIIQHIPISYPHIVGGHTISTIRNRYGMLSWKGYLTGRTQREVEEAEKKGLPRDEVFEWDDVDSESLSKIWLPYRTPRTDSLKKVALLIGHEFSYDRLHRYAGKESPLCILCGSHTEDIAHWMIECPANNFPHSKWMSALKTKLESLSSRNKTINSPHICNIIDRETSRFNRKIRARFTAGLVTKSLKKKLKSKLRLKEPTYNKVIYSLLSVSREYVTRRWAQRCKQVHSRLKFQNSNSPPQPSPHK